MIVSNLYEVCEQELHSTTTPEELQELSHYIIGNEFPWGLKAKKRVDWIPLIWWLDKFRSFDVVLGIIQEFGLEQVFDFFKRDDLKAFIERAKNVTPHPDFKAINKLYVRSYSGIAYD